MASPSPWPSFQARYHRSCPATTTRRLAGSRRRLARCSYSSCYQLPL